MSFDWSPVKTFRLLVLGIKNSGDKPTLFIDFESAISISLVEEAQVLSVEITKQFRLDLNVKF